MVSPTGPGSYKLLQAFEGLFRGKLYRHRDATLGNFVAVHLYEDLLAGSYSAKFKQRVEAGVCVVNVSGSTQGVNARRGDGTFGVAVPNSPSLPHPDFAVPRGRVALTQIGTEMKILAKPRSQIKQIERVISSLVQSVGEIRKKSPKAIAVGFAAVNYSESYTSMEGSREFPVDLGVTAAAREADDVSRRINEQARPAFDEFFLFKFKATNRPPYPFTWLNAREVEHNYGAALVRIANAYDERF